MTRTPVRTYADLALLSEEEVAVVDAWWRAALYLTVGQIYLARNPLLRQPLSVEDVKPRLLGHWGTSPGLAFVYAHVSRMVRETGQRAIYLAGPGHGGPALVAASWLEGTYTETYPEVTRDAVGMQRLFRQFSTPGGIPSHVSVTTPGSIHEGGELGYVLVHAFGAVMDDPDLVAVAVVGDGEAETGPLEGSWKGISFLDPVHDGAVLPVLHLNDAKISGPTVLGRKDPAEVRALFTGHGYHVIEVEGSDLPGMHHRFAEALSECWARIRQIQDTARTGGWDGVRPRWPMIVLRSPKGWTGPREVDGVRIEGTYRSHQVPLSGVRENPAHLEMLGDWLATYRPEELFDADGVPTTGAQDPSGSLRMSAEPAANGGVLTRDLVLRDLAAYAVEVASPGTTQAESTRRLGRMLRDVYTDNPTSFRLFCPDETTSNRLGDVFEVSDRAFAEAVVEDDVHLAHGGRVMEVLSEHSCHGWLEGYTLTGRHGLFATYEAFAMVSASQTVQHSKWLEESLALEWRAPVPSLNVLLTSTAWRNDHNGFSHQGPGLIQVMLTHRGAVTRIYLPPDANCLLSVAEHCLGSRDYVNLVVIDKQPQLQYLDLEAARAHCAAGAGVWEWAGNEPALPSGAPAQDPDLVLACAGDTPTLEAVAAAQILRERLPALRTRVVNVVDLMSLPRPTDHPHGMSAAAFTDLFTDTVDVVFAFHGFPGAVHQLVHGRPDADRFHVRGFVEEGTTTTPFDMTVLNRVSRFHLVLDALNNSRTTLPGTVELREWCAARLVEHHAHVREHMQDLPEIRDYRVGGPIS